MSPATPGGAGNLPPLLRLADVCALLSVSRVTVWQWRRRKSNPFPAPVMLSPTCPRWREADVRQWLAKAEQRRAA